MKHSSKKKIKKKLGLGVQHMQKYIPLHRFNKQLIVLQI